MTIPYRIFKIETNQFATFPDPFDNGSPVNVQTSFQFAASMDISNVRCQAHILYKQGDCLLLVLDISTYFSIGDEGIKEIRKQGKVPVDFLRYIATIAVGAARGIIHAKTEGTVLNAVVLPPINLVEIIHDDLVVAVNQ